MWQLLPLIAPSAARVVYSDMYLKLPSPPPTPHTIITTTPLHQVSDRGISCLLHERMETSALFITSHLSTRTSKCCEYVSVQTNRYLDPTQRELISARNIFLYVTQVQQQRPKSAMVTLTWHACKYKVYKLQQRYIISFCFRSVEN